MANCAQCFLFKTSSMISFQKLDSFFFFYKLNFKFIYLFEWNSTVGHFESTHLHHVGESGNREMR